MLLQLHAYCALQAAAAQQVAAQAQASLAEDGSLFDYDSWHDADTSGKPKRGKTVAPVLGGAAAPERRPQYIHAMMAVAAKRVCALHVRIHGSRNSVPCA